VKFWSKREGPGQQGRDSIGLTQKDGEERKHIDWSWWVGKGGEPKKRALLRVKGKKRKNQLDAGMVGSLRKKSGHGGKRAPWCSPAEEWG